MYGGAGDNRPEVLLEEETSRCCSYLRIVRMRPGCLFSFFRRVVFLHFVKSIYCRVWNLVGLGFRFSGLRRTASTRATVTMS